MAKKKARLVCLPGFERLVRYELTVVTCFVSQLRQSDRQNYAQHDKEYEHRHKGFKMHFQPPEAMVAGIVSTDLGACKRLAVSRYSV